MPRHTGRIIVGAVFGVVVLVVGALAFIRVPYYRWQPGTLYQTESRITVSGEPTFATDGQIDFTTVSSKRATVLEAAFARFNPGVDLVPIETVDANNTPEQTQAQNSQMMADSKEQAEYVASKKLGYPVETLGTGALVIAVGKERRPRRCSRRTTRSSRSTARRSSWATKPSRRSAPTSPATPSR